MRLYRSLGEAVMQARLIIKRFFASAGELSAWPLKAASAASSASEHDGGSLQSTCGELGANPLYRPARYHLKNVASPAELDMSPEERQQEYYKLLEQREEARRLEQANTGGQSERRKAKEMSEDGEKGSES